MTGKHYFLQNFGNPPVAREIDKIDLPAAPAGPCDRTMPPHLSESCFPACSPRGRRGTGASGTFSLMLSRAPAQDPYADEDDDEVVKGTP